MNKALIAYAFGHSCKMFTDMLDSLDDLTLAVIERLEESDWNYSLEERREAYLTDRISLSLKNALRDDMMKSYTLMFSEYNNERSQYSD